jgi:UPF0271 protein
MKLNCDLGESFGAWKMGLDEEIMPFIDSANIACGFHASDPMTMLKTVKLALKNGVHIGAHPGYPDLVGFGRRSMKCSQEEIEAFVIYQISALVGIAKTCGGKVEYVKPHGALYNDMMANEAVFNAILKAVSAYDKTLKLMILSSSKNENYEALAKSYGIGLIYEVFADRAYTKEGFLVPRTTPNSVLHDAEVIKKRIELLQTKGELETIEKEHIKIKADSMCVHGDNEQALNLVKSLREYLPR